MWRGSDGLEAGAAAERAAVDRPEGIVVRHFAASEASLRPASKQKHQRSGGGE